MQGNNYLIACLNDLLADELTAINQYMVHAEMCEDWGYTRLSHSYKKRSITEMHHAEKLIERILFLEGVPLVSNLNDINIGGTPAQQVINDHELELHAVRAYNEAVKLAAEAHDFATREILLAILADEDAHVDELEEQQDQIDQMGLQLFLASHN